MNCLLKVLAYVVMFFFVKYILLQIMWYKLNYAIVLIS